METYPKPKAFELDTFAVKREGQPDRSYELKRHTGNALRVLGSVAYAGLVRLDRVYDRLYS